MRQSVIALLIGFPIVCPLYIWKMRVDRQMGRELAANNPLGLPSPALAAVTTACLIALIVAV